MIQSPSLPPAPPISPYLSAVQKITGSDLLTAFLGLDEEDKSLNHASQLGAAKKMGCDDASFMKSKAAVLEAISLYTKVDVDMITCVDNAVQVSFLPPRDRKFRDDQAVLWQATDVDIYYTTVGISGEEKVKHI